MQLDSFGNQIDPSAGFAWGKVLADIEVDGLRHAKMRRMIAERVNKLGPVGLYDITGVHRHFLVDEKDKPYLDEWLGETYLSRIRDLVFKIMGGDAETDDIFIANRTTAAILAALLTLVREGDTVVAVAPVDGKKYRSTYTHPCVLKGVALARGNFVEVYGPKELEVVLKKDRKVSVVVINGVGKFALDVFPEKDLKEAIEIAKKYGKYTVKDDAWGRIRSAVFHQPKTRETGIDIGVQALDKLALPGPRFGLVVGGKDLVARVRATAYRYAWEARPTFFPGVMRSLEKYDPQEFGSIRNVSRKIVTRLNQMYGDGMATQISVGFRIGGDEIFRILTNKAGSKKPRIVPYEACQALGMMFLQNYGVLTIPVMAAPVGSPGMKALPTTEQVGKFGGVEAFVKALDDSFNRVAAIIDDPGEVSELLLGKGKLLIAKVSR